MRRGSSVVVMLITFMLPPSSPLSSSFHFILSYASVLSTVSIIPTACFSAIQRITINLIARWVDGVYIFEAAVVKIWKKSESRRKDKLEQVAMFPARHAERECTLCKPRCYSFHQAKCPGTREGKRCRGRGIGGTGAVRNACRDIESGVGGKMFFQRN